jgi:multidrug efflux pump subunit AcrA (membrane-fusion protein)
MKTANKFFGKNFPKKSQNYNMNMVLSKNNHYLCTQFQTDTKLKTLPSFAVALVICLLPSCGGNEADNVPAYRVERKSFTNYIETDGYTEPVRMVSANCPPEIEGTLEYIVDDGTPVKEGDIVCRIKVQSYQTEYDAVMTEYETIKAELNTKRATLNMERAMLEAQVKDNEAQTAIAGLDSLQLSFMTENEVKIKHLELEQAAINKARYEKKLAALDIIQSSELKRMELRIQRRERRIEDIKQKIADLNVKAPKSGLAIRGTSYDSGLKLKAGDNVWSNMPIVKIPDVAEMKVKMSVPEMDFKSINVGDSVVYSFDAMPDNIGFGKISKKNPVGNANGMNIRVYGGGVVVMYSSSGQQKSKVKFFDIEATVDSVLVMPEPGFSANCRVILKQVTDTIIVPQIAVYDEDSIKVAFVRLKDGFEMREVTTGISSQKEVVISEGLHENELVALTRPKNFLVKKKTFLNKDSDSIQIAKL